MDRALLSLVTNVAFRAFSCYPEFDDGRSYLIADVNVQCTAGGEFTDAYVGVRVTAWFAIGVYAFGLIALNAALLYAAREAILENRSTPLSRAIRFLYREYGALHGHRFRSNLAAACAPSLPVRRMSTRA